jgi:hypothetical protein
MRRRATAFALCLPLTLAVVLPATDSLAQEDPGGTAIDAGRAGIELFQEGKFEAALAKFREGDAISHSPVFQIYIARCLVHLGRLIAARATYQQILDEPVADDAPPPWKHAKVDARAELGGLLPRIPSIKPVLLGGDASTTVTVDGAPARAGAAVEVDPGKRTVVATHSGIRREVVIDVGEREKEKPATIDLRSGKPPPPPPPPPSVEPEPKEGSLVPGAVLLGVGGAGLLVGAITGGVALAKASDIHDRCGTDDGTCPRSLEGQIQPDIDQANTLGYVSTGMLIGGGVVASVGIVLLIVRPGGSDGEPAGQPVVFFRPAIGGGVFGGAF